jgi:hypothetical protein
MGSFLLDPHMSRLITGLIHQKEKKKFMKILRRHLCNKWNSVCRYRNVDSVCTCNIKTAPYHILR